MYPRTAIVTLAAVFLVTTMGCVTSGGSSSGWVVVGQPASSPPPASQKARPPKSKKNTMGQETAARNHIRSAYRFLEKGKPDHAMREMEKARRKMGQDYWFHYYYGGAYFLKGMFGQARDSWERAYGFTRDYSLRSRIRTCQSFAIYNLDGEGPSMGVLKKAVDMDRQNSTAWELFQDLGGSDTGRQSGYDKSSSSPYVQQKLGQSGGPEDYDDKASKKGHGKDKPKRGSADKKKDKKRKIQDGERFRAYFMIEMP